MLQILCQDANTLYVLLIHQYFYISIEGISTFIFIFYSISIKNQKWISINMFVRNETIKPINFTLFLIFLMKWTVHFNRSPAVMFLLLWVVVENKPHLFLMIWISAKLKKLEVRNGLQLLHVIKYNWLLSELFHVLVKLSWIGL